MIKRDNLFWMSPNKHLLRKMFKMNDTLDGFWHFFTFLRRNMSHQEKVNSSLIIIQKKKRWLSEKLFLHLYLLHICVVQLSWVGRIICSKNFNFILWFLFRIRKNAWFFLSLFLIVNFDISRWEKWKLFKNSVGWLKILLIW